MAAFIHYVISSSNSETAKDSVPVEAIAAVAEVTAGDTETNPPAAPAVEENKGGDQEEFAVSLPVYSGNNHEVAQIEHQERHENEETTGEAAASDAGAVAAAANTEDRDGSAPGSQEFGDATVNDSTEEAVADDVVAGVTAANRNDAGDAHALVDVDVDDTENDGFDADNHGHADGEVAAGNVVDDGNADGDLAAGNVADDGDANGDVAAGDTDNDGANGADVADGDAANGEDGDVAGDEDGDVAGGEDGDADVADGDGDAAAAAGEGAAGEGAAGEGAAAAAEDNDAAENVAWQNDVS